MFGAGLSPPEAVRPREAPRSKPKPKAVFAVASGVVVANQSAGSVPVPGPVSAEVAQQHQQGQLQQQQQQQHQPLLPPQPQQQQQPRVGVSRPRGLFVHNAGGEQYQPQPRKLLGDLHFSAQANYGSRREASKGQAQPPKPARELHQELYEELLKQDGSRLPGALGLEELSAAAAAAAAASVPVPEASGSVSAAMRRESVYSVARGGSPAAPRRPAGNGEGAAGDSVRRLSTVGGRSTWSVLSPFSPALTDRERRAVARDAAPLDVAPAGGGRGHADSNASVVVAVPQELQFLSSTPARASVSEDLPADRAQRRAVELAEDVARDNLGAVGVEALRFSRNSPRTLP